MTGYSSVIYEFNKKRQLYDEYPVFEKLQESFNYSESNTTVRMKFFILKFLKRKHMKSMKYFK